MDGEHGGPPDVALFCGALGRASRTLESRDARRAYITRMLLTTAIYPDNIGLKIEEFRHESGA
jgi:hypothetical protein